MRSLTLVRTDLFLEYRFLNLASPSRILATADPTFEDFLPVDDERFADAVGFLTPLSLLHKDVGLLANMKVCPDVATRGCRHHFPGVCIQDRTFRQASSSNIPYQSGSRQHQISFCNSRLSQWR